MTMVGEKPRSVVWLYRTPPVIKAKRAAIQTWKYYTPRHRRRTLSDRLFRRS